MKTYDLRKIHANIVQYTPPYLVSQHTRVSHHNIHYTMYHTTQRTPRRAIHDIHRTVYRTTPRTSPYHAMIYNYSHTITIATIPPSTPYCSEHGSILVYHTILVHYTRPRTTLHPLPHQIVYRTKTCRAVLHPYCIMLHHTISYTVIHQTHRTYHTIPYNTIKYHTIPYNITQWHHHTVP